MTRYKASALVIWEFDGDGDPIKQAEDKLASILDYNEDLETRIKVDRLRIKQKKVVLGEFSTTDVLSNLCGDDEKKEFLVDDQIYYVRMNSHRYFCFQASLKCASCGIEGIKMLLEKHPHDKHPHFNLYADVLGDLVLMTKDHIRAKAYGGQDCQSNYQTMCSICNCLKGSANLTLDGIKQLRQLYNEQKPVLPKKKLTEELNKLRGKLQGPHDWNADCRLLESTKTCKAKAKQDTVILKTDILIIEKDGSFKGVSVYDAENSKTGKHVACLKQGAILSPIDRKKKRLFVQYNDTRFSLYHGFVE